MHGASDNALTIEVLVACLASSICFKYMSSSSYSDELEASSSCSGCLSFFKRSHKFTITFFAVSIWTGLSKILKRGCKLTAAKTIGFCKTVFSRFRIASNKCCAISDSFLMLCIFNRRLTHKPKKSLSVKCGL